MYTAIVVLHLFAAFVMIGAILLQAGKGAEIGATFGGSSQTIFGGRGATTFLAKFTVACAVIFMLTSLSLAFMSKERSIGTSIKPPEPPAASESAPPSDEAMPAGSATATGSERAPAESAGQAASQGGDTAPAPSASTADTPAAAAAPPASTK